MVEDPDTILGIKKIDIEHGKRDTEFDNLFEYIMTLFGKLLNKVSIQSPQIKYELRIPGEITSAYSVYKTMNDGDDRMRLTKYGCDIWNDFYKALP